MLREDEFAVLALALAAVGIGLLFIYTENAEPASLRISEIGKEWIGKEIQTHGIIQRTVSGENFLSFELKDQNLVSAVLFNPTLSQRALIQKNFRVKVFGKIQKQNGKLQIQVKEVNAFD